MIIHYMAHAPLAGMTAPPDGGPLIFKPDRRLITVYTVLQMIAWCAFIVGFSEFIWVSLTKKKEAK